jgi:hypothetical protein
MTSNNYEKKSIWGNHERLSQGLNTLRCHILAQLQLSELTGVDHKIVLIYLTEKLAKRLEKCIMTWLQVTSSNFYIQSCT